MSCEKYLNLKNKSVHSELQLTKQLRKLLMKNPKMTYPTRLQKNKFNTYIKYLYCRIK